MRVRVCAWPCVFVCVTERERECVCVCVCVCERERKRERVCVATHSHTRAGGMSKNVVRSGDQGGGWGIRSDVGGIPLGTQAALQG